MLPADGFSRGFGRCNGCFGGLGDRVGWVQLVGKGCEGLVVIVAVNITLGSCISC